MKIPKSGLPSSSTAITPSPHLIEQIVVESGRFGNATIRRIYGDWTTSNMKSWKDILNSYAFQPIQQFRYTVGKNATDSA